MTQQGLLHAKPTPPPADPPRQAGVAAFPEDEAPPRGAVHRDQLEFVIRDKRRAVRDYWHQFPDTMRFLMDTMPDLWDEISRCRQSYRTWRLGGTDWYKVTPLYTCQHQPWCVTCVRASNNRRIKATLDAFSLCTPKGQEMRFIGIVQTAPVFEDGARGWGEGAYRDPGKFLGVVARVLREAYGSGLGVHQTFQPFGERAFKKWHPHSDLILNGYAIERDGTWRAIPEYDLTPDHPSGHGRKHWNDLVIKHASKAFPDEDVAGTQSIGRDLHMLKPILGHKPFYPILKYKLREMVDVRKIAYNREQRMVWWQSYRDNTRTPYTIEEFFYGVKTYQRMYGAWGDDGTKRFNRRYGHMADNSINYTARNVGGTEIPHGRTCPCSDCNNWNRVFLDEVERAVGPARPVRLD